MQIKFRQPIYHNGKSERWHYWGFVGGTFIDPVYGEAPGRGMKDVQDSSQQFTGLKDKNDKEIYEGDIVKHKTGDIWIVEFVYGEHDGFAWQGYECFCKSLWNGIVVIGNTIENPELLKVE